MITAFLIVILPLLAHNAQSRDSDIALEPFDRSLSESGSECSNFSTDEEWGFKSGYGFYFDVYTLAEIQIKGIGVHSLKRDSTVPTVVQVWKRQGSGTYVGAEMEADKWEKIQTVDGLQANGLAQITVLPDFDAAITVQPGAMQAFHIVSNQPVLMGLPYDKRRGYTGKDDGILKLLAGDITLTEGTLADIPADQEPVLWNGMLNYCQMGDPIDTPALARQITDENCSFITLDSRFWGDVPVYGNYFDMMASIDIKIVGFQVHASSTISQISIYSTKEGPHDGKNSEEAQWDLLHAQSGVEVVGSEQHTDLEMLDTPFLLAKGEKRGFLVVSTEKTLLSKSMLPAGLAFSFDQYIKMFNGPIATGEAFTSSNGSYGFNGGVKYCIDVDGVLVIV